MAFLILFLLSVLVSKSAWAEPANDFVALSYHEVVHSDAHVASPTAVRVSDLGAQFAWLKANGYRPVSVDQILAARQGGPALPAKAVLLTFDDGLKDFYSRAFPLLKLFNYPAVMAVVGQWLELPAGAVVDYDGVSRSRDDFVSWAEIRYMQASGLVEVASHAYALHQGIPANPQGNTEPAAITRYYADGRYESDVAYEKRLRLDLSASSALIAQHTGLAPRVLVWPYGRNNLVGQEIAREVGFQLAFTLEDGVTNGATPLIQARRHLIERSPSLHQFAEILRRVWGADPTRSVKIDPGHWLGEDEIELSAMLDRLLALQPKVAFLTLRVIGADGERVLFPTMHRPMARDVLNRIAWQIEQRAGVSVFIDLPADWPAYEALIADLARYVNFAGLRLNAEPGSPMALRVRALAERWRWPLRLAYVSPGPISSVQWTNIAPGDFIILPAETDLAQLPESAKVRALFEFDPALPQHAIATRMRQLEAAGFRQFGLAGMPSAESTDIEAALSLRSSPQLR